MALHWVSRDELMQSAQARLVSVDVLLDLGAGIHREEWVAAKLQILCEPYDEYVQVLKEKYQHNPGIVIVQSTAQACLEALPAGSVDTILLIDVIEHLEKDAGLELLRQCERAARCQIALFTPLGYMPQDYEWGDADGWGLSGGFWQRHLSGWLPEEFDESWDVFACREFHIINGKGEPFDPPFGAFFAIKTKTTSEAPASVFGGLIQNHILLVERLTAFEQIVAQLLQDHAGLVSRSTSMEEARQTLINSLQAQIESQQQSLDALAQQLAATERKLSKLPFFRAVQLWQKLTGKPESQSPRG